MQPPLLTCSACLGVGEGQAARCLLAAARHTWIARDAGRARTARAAGARAQHLAQLPAQLPAQLRGQVPPARLAAGGRGLIDQAQELGLVAVDQRQQLRVLLAQLLRAAAIKSAALILQGKV